MRPANYHRQKIPHGVFYSSDDFLSFIILSEVPQFFSLVTYIGKPIKVGVAINYANPVLNLYPT